MGVIDDGETLSLTFFADEVSFFLNKDIHTCMDKLVELEDKILDIDSTYDKIQTT